MNDYPSFDMCSECTADVLYSDHPHYLTCPYYAKTWVYEDTGEVDECMLIPGCTPIFVYKKDK